MRSRLALAFACLTFALASTATPAFAGPYAGSGRWYWPVGYEGFGAMSGYWDFRGYCWHLAQDMRSPAGHQVVAIGSGTVLESRYISGYGPGGASGGAVVILHRTATGREFKALYGHLSGLRYHKGDRVAAGAVIGVVNGSSPNHLHFGIHPGRAYPSDGNPFRGHTYTSRTTYGWVDPVAFLASNPRVISYRAPGVPAVARVETSGTPQWASAGCGRAVWSEASGEESATWVIGLASGCRSLVTTPSMLPADESARYRVLLLLGTPGFIVRDLQPRLTIRLSDTTPAAGQAVGVTGSVRNAAGSVFVGAKVKLQALAGSEWKTIATTVTTAAGTYSFTYRPSAVVTLRTEFVPPSTFTVGRSGVVTARTEY